MNENDTSTNGNIDQVVVPVLCNLAACCIQLKVIEQLSISCYNRILGMGKGC